MDNSSCFLHFKAMFSALVKARKKRVCLVLAGKQQKCHEWAPISLDITFEDNDGRRVCGEENSGGLVVRVRFNFQTWRHMWVEFVGSLLCSERFFPGYSGFPSPQKPAFD